jgi:hypothetical protein
MISPEPRHLILELDLAGVGRCGAMICPAAEHVGQEGLRAWLSCEESTGGEDTTDYSNERESFSG